MSRKPLTNTQRSQIAMLQADGQSVASMSRQTGLARDTCKKALSDPETVELVEVFSKQLGEKMLELADTIVAGIDSEVIAKAGLRDRLVGAGILIDKGRGAFGLDKPIPLAVQINLNTPIDLSKYQ